jgi:hypothetical protein
MIPLLVITSCLLLASGLLKVRAAARVEMGVPILALAELLAAVGIFGVAFVVKLTAGQGMFILVGSVALIVVSSVQVGMEVRRRQRIRSASEGARLASYVKHTPAKPPERSK